MLHANDIISEPFDDLFVSCVHVWICISTQVQLVPSVTLFSTQLSLCPLDICFMHGYRSQVEARLSQYVPAGDV